MQRRRSQAGAAAALLAIAASVAGCGYILYPERRGNPGGTIAGGTLAMDLLWLIPGIMPGVVALVVDFTSGAMYVNRGEHMAVAIPRDGRVAVRVPDSQRDARLELRLVTDKQRVVARTTANVGPKLHGQTVELRVAAAERSEPLYLEVVGANGQTARFPTAMEVAR